MEYVSGIIQTLDNAQIWIVFFVAGAASMLLGTIRLKKVELTPRGRIMWQILGWVFFAAMFVILFLGKLK
jgi:hypothetical protein